MARVSKIDDGKLKELVAIGGMSVKEMAEQLGATSSCVYARMAVLGLNTRVSRPGKQKTPRPAKEKKLEILGVSKVRPIVEVSLEEKIQDAMREWATKNADKLLWLAGEKRIFYTITGYMPTQILEPYIDKAVQELQGRDWYLENGEVKKKR